MFEHFPLNHRLRPLFRGVAAITGLGLLGFGILAYWQSSGGPMFATENLANVMGLTANRGLGMAAAVSGVVVLIALLIGHNIDSLVNLVVSIVFMAAGLAMMPLIGTGSNFLGFSMANCIASLLIGAMLLTACLYGRIGSLAEAQAQEMRRCGPPPPLP